MLVVVFHSPCVTTRINFFILKIESFFWTTQFKEKISLYHTHEQDDQIGILSYEPRLPEQTSKTPLPQQICEDGLQRGTCIRA